MPPPPPPPPGTNRVKLGLKNLAKLPSYFDYIFVHLSQKVRLRPELSPKFLLTLDPNPTRKARPDLQLWRSAIKRNDFFIFFMAITQHNFLKLLQTGVLLTSLNAN